MNDWPTEPKSLWKLMPPPQIISWSWRVFTLRLWKGSQSLYFQQVCLVWVHLKCWGTINVLLRGKFGVVSLLFWCCCFFVYSLNGEVAVDTLQTAVCFESMNLVRVLDKGVDYNKGVRHINPLRYSYTTIKRLTAQLQMFSLLSPC